MIVGGLRPDEVQVPANYNPAVAAPLLIVLHGFTQNGATMDNNFGLKTTAYNNGIIYMSPNGIMDSVGLRFWHATDACCDILNAGQDDSAYILSLINEVSSQLNVDQKRIYLMGYSNGAFMAHRFACDHADKIAAIITFAGMLHDKKE